MNDQTVSASPTTLAPRHVVGAACLASSTRVTANPTCIPDGVEIELDESPFVGLVLTEPPEPPAPPLELGEGADADWTDWQEMV